MEGHSQLANCVRGKTTALFKPWRYLVSKPPNLDVAKEARILCDAAYIAVKKKNPYEPGGKSKPKFPDFPGILRKN